MEKIFYLDNAATTKVFDEEYEILKNSDELFFNPSASYMPAIKVKKKFDEARETIKKVAGASSENLIFVSSATEANNTVFEGLHLRAGQTVLISAAEHPSVFQSAHRLERRGIVVKEIPLERDGTVCLAEFEKLLDNTVALVSVIHVSNETGAVNDIKKLVDIAKSFNPKIIFHSDGVQAFGKISVNIKNLGVDLYTVSAHKVYAPRGIAGLFVKKGIVLDPLLVGGGQENGLRSSTENVAGALMFAYAANKVASEIQKNYDKVLSLKNELLKKFEESNILKNVKCNSNQNCSPYILSLSFDGIKGEVLMNALETFGVLISTGSACSSKKAGNRILEAMNLSATEVVGSIRISFSPYINYDIDYIVKSFENCVGRFLKNK